MKKKTLFLLCVCIIGIVIVTLLPRNVDVITNAVVNSENGDIAFCYLDYSQRIAMLNIAVFNRDGEELFTKSIFSNGGAYASLRFYEDNLCVYDGRMQETYFFNRDGDSINLDVTVEEIRETGAFDGWKSSFGKKSYSLDEYVYCYETPNIFKHQARLTISYGENVNVIYESPSVP